MAQAATLTTPQVLAAPFHDKIVLRRTGKKTLRFAGDALTEATGYSRLGSHWYEIAAYSRVVGGYVASIRHFYKDAQERDGFIAERFDTLEEVMAFIEDFHASDDLAIRFDPASKDLSAAEVTVLAAGLRARQAEYQHAYQSVSGQVLHSLDALQKA